MKPLQLTLTEVRNYAGASTIDVTDGHPPGDTRSGKSTILEAILFALYRTPSWPEDAEEPSRIALEDTTTEAP
ncbi:hypothetical protein EJ357_47840 [Streptomyces cyaneochromogenes]|uniref:Rad50/SbcC-type AAA domain-containing protein n=1 Tax=Streptomyces cyaneochromogenes TaxID=2496836 RepID=A0A3Q9F031_9ACTN|nr:hypothetical protein [Streptomyces cyaneochromogenes]AZQ32088.1 hypothetical protein EJ357_00090 [Streptomyces cyaneochromogenes]AZQ40135.1 hypothetical protein EJ357_47840 [Streptomyces cyaneochromogenes]